MVLEMHYLVSHDRLYLVPVENGEQTAGYEDCLIPSPDRKCEGLVGFYGPDAHASQAFEFPQDIRESPQPLLIIRELTRSELTENSCVSVSPYESRDECRSRQATHH